MLENSLVFCENYKIIFNTNQKLDEFLELNYNDLYNSIQKDNYSFDYLGFDLFREIIREDEIIGFIALNIFEQKRFSIEECYIKEEFRGKGIIYEEILKLGSLPNVYLYVRRPNYAFMNMLKKHRVAENVLDNIMRVGIEIIADTDDIYVNPESKYQYKTLEKSNRDFFSDYVYDMDSKLIFMQDIWCNFTSDPGNILIIKPRKSDLERFDYDKILKEFDDKRIGIISSRLYNRHSDIENAWGIWEVRLDEYNAVDVVVGTSSKLTDEMSQILKEHDLNPEMGFKIRQDLIKAEDMVEIKRKYSRFRRDYLVENPQMIGKIAGRDIIRDENGIRCPFCEQYTARGFENCDYCGYDFENEDYREQFVYNNTDEKYILDESIEYGSHDYPTGYYDWDTYRVLSYIKQNNSSVKEAFNSVDLNCSSKALLEQIIIDYVKPDLDEGIDLKKELMKMSIKELSVILRDNGISAGGKKKKLANLIIKNNILPQEFGNRCKLSEDGEEFLNDNSWIGIYDEFLTKFEFDDFYRFLEDSDDFIQSILDLLEEYLRIANEKNDADYIEDCKQAKSKILAISK